MIEHHVGVWEGRRHNWSLGPAAAARLAAAELRLARAAAARPLRRRRSSAIPATSTCPRRSGAARGRPLVFNPLVSLHETLVDDRRRFAPGLPGGARAARASTGSRSAAPTSSSPTPRRTPLPRARSADLPPDRVAVCFVGAEERLFTPGWRAPDALPRALRRQADPAARARDDPRRGPARAGDPVPHRRQRPARRPPARPAAERRVGPRGSTTSSCRRSSRRAAARSASSAPPPRRPRDPEQGVPGARLRHAAHHRRHACGPRAPARRRERAARPARRRRRARGSPAEARRRSRPRRAARRRRARHLSEPGERGRARRALARRSSSALAA